MTRELRQTAVFPREGRDMSDVTVPIAARRPLRPADLAWVLATASVPLVVAAVAMPMVWSFERPFSAYAVVIAILYPAIGAVVAARQPRNAVGWLLIAIGLAEGASSLMATWATLALDVAPGAVPGGLVAAWFADWLWMPAYALAATFLPLLFPDGRLLSRRWRPVAGLAAAGLTIQLAAPLSVLPQLRLRTASAGTYPDERLASILGAIGYGIILATAVLCVTGLVWRLSRMPAEQRGPYVWFAGGALVTVVLLLPLNVVSHPLAHEILQFVAVISIPVGALVAIVRHRAYGIDLVINRTLVYAVLSVVLTGIYLAVAAVAHLLLDGADGLPAVSAAAATALVLAPTRGWLQRTINRLMYGQRDDAQQIVAAIGSRLETIAAASDPLADLTAQIAQAFRLPYVAIETAEAKQTRVLAATGSVGASHERIPLLVKGEGVGALVVAPRRGQTQLTSRDRRGLGEIAPIVATAVKQDQLTTELQRARERLASDLEEERRRIRRDLHDGLGPNLATIVMGLDETRAVHRDDPHRADTLLRELKDQAKEAIADIRTLVYGLRPPALDDFGLLGAIRTLLATSTRGSIVVDLSVPPKLPALPAAIEVAAYRIVQESVTNVLRHAHAAHVEVGLACRGDALEVTVRDDGRGLGNGVVDGVGLTSIRERVQDVGGRVTIRSVNGTTVEAVLPVGTPCTI
jgi:signal transduction histidine kinase